MAAQNHKVGGRVFYCYDDIIERRIWPSSAAAVLVWLRTHRTKGSGSRIAMLTMVFGKEQTEQAA
jgi:hypothetical protein